MRAFLQNHLGGLPTLYWYVWGGTLLNRLGGFVVPFLALYLTDQVGTSISVAGRIAALYGGGSLLAGLVGGAVADRFGRKPTLVIGLAVGGVAMIGLGFAQELRWIAVFTFLVGFFSDLSRPAVSAMISDIVPPQQRTRAYGLLHWAVNIGFSVAPLIAGYLATRNYRALFIADAITTLAYAALVLFKVPETRPALVADRPPLLKALATPLRDPVFMSFAVLAFLIAMVFFQFEAALPIDMRAHGVTPGTYGRLIAINGILIAVLQPFAAGWLATFKRSHVLAAAALLTGLGFGLPAIIAVPGETGAWIQIGLPTVAIYATAIVIWTLGEILNAPVTPAIAADLAPENLRGSYQGALQMVWGCAFFLSPAIGTLVMEHLGARTLWLSCLAVSCGIAALHFVIAPARRRRIAVMRSARPGDLSTSED